MKHSYWKRRLLLLILPSIVLLGHQEANATDNPFGKALSASNLNSAPTGKGGSATILAVGDNNWSAVGSGINDGSGGYVETVALSGSAVYVGGSFLSISGNTNCSRVAKWNGTAWEALGKGVVGNGVVYAVAVSGSNVYVAGSFTQLRQSDNSLVSANRVARWDGTQWSALGNGFNSDVYALAVDGSGNLYAGGDFTTDGVGSGTYRRVALWNGSAWSEVSGGLNSTVEVIGINGSNVYVGGGFTADGSGIGTLKRIVIKNGATWQEVGGGVGNASVQSISFSGSNIYIGGSFRTKSDGVSYLGSFAALKSGVWENVGGSIPYSGYVRSVAIVNSDVYVAGLFSQVANDVALTSLVGANCIAKWTPSGSDPTVGVWTAMGSGINVVDVGNDRSESIQFASSGGNLYVGGAFDGAGGVSNTQNIAKWKIPATYSYSGFNLTLTVVEPIGGPPSITFTGSMPDGSLPTGINAISRYYWTVSSTMTFQNGKVSAPLSALGPYSSAANLRWLKRENPGDAWTDIGGDVTDGTNLVSTTTFTNLSQFAVGSTRADDALPVELSTFSGAFTGKGVSLSWKTQSETNNLGFVLLRDGEEIASYRNKSQLKGQGSKATPTSYTYTDEEVEVGNVYTYKLRTVDLDGTVSEYSPIVTVRVLQGGQTKAYEYALDQNYPNPFNPETVIRFTMKVSGRAVLRVYDILGRQVWLKDVTAKEGVNEFRFNGGNLPTGLYFYRLQANGFDKTMKMLLVK